jgi:hypothetical protein
MNKPDDSLRNRLLSQYVPEPGKLASYRKEIDAMFEHEERWLRCEAWISSLSWIWAVLLGTAFALVAGSARDQPAKVYFSIGVMLLLLIVAGAVEMLKLVINRARLEVVKDLKGLELRLAEIEGRLAARDQ